jgi:glycerol kinase
MKYILALDQGTTSSRALLFDEAGNVRALAQREFRQIFPQPGWVEHDPNDIWTSQLEVAREALRKAGIGARELAAIGIANQRETTLIWDRVSGEPIANAIVWQDRRTVPLCEQLVADGKTALFQEKTGLVIDPYFSGTKIAWLLDNVPGARARAERGELAFGTVDSWLVWKLTGGRCHLTDVTNASRTLLFDIARLDWDEQLLAALRVPRALLPQVRASSEIYAETDAQLLGAPVPIGGIAGDQQAALFGQACATPGMAKNTYGTGCFALLQVGERRIASRHKLLTTVGWRIGNDTCYALEGAVFVAGAAVQWLRDGLGIIQSSAEVEALAQSVPDSGGVYLVPAFTGLGAPHWNPHARGVLCGLTRGSGRGHIARATLEGIAHQVADVLDTMQEDASVRLSELRVDGGAAANNLLMQLQADLLQVPVVRPKITETTALGAAYLAGLAAGFWPNRAALTAQWQPDRVFEPILSLSNAKAMRSGWRNALARALL